MEGCVAFHAVDGVAFEAFLVQEHVDYFVCGGCQQLSVSYLNNLSLVQRAHVKRKLQCGAFAGWVEEERGHTVSPQRSLMVKVIAQHSLRLVQQDSRLFRIAYFIDHFLQKVGIVSACCLNEKFGVRCTLQTVSMLSKRVLICNIQV